MDYSQFVYILEIIGTIAFAFSGALLGIHKNMDIFGVNVLGLTTAVGGGIVRDIMLGITPPNIFIHPSYAVVAVLTSSILFGVIYYNRALLNDRHNEGYTKIMNAMDAIGLSAFTVIGINAAIGAAYADNAFLLIFVGVITGVGGGIMRDIMAGDTPYIFVKHVYASASIAGAVICVLLKGIIGNKAAMIIGAVLVCIIRFLAAHYRWNLPRIFKQ